ncbi:hypothetical protein BOW28_11705, partial [Solemya velum gill symbiont]
MYLLTYHPKTRPPWNKGRLIGQKPPLKPREIWSILVRLQIDPPPISWSTLMMSKTEDRKWESNDTNRKKSSR